MPVGASLAAAREEAGLTVAEVAEQTRIRATVVRAIESDDFSLCGGDVYARGHVRSIARAVGADPDAFVAEFDASHAQLAPTAAEVFESETATRRERRGPNWSAVMATVLVAAVAVLGFQLVSGGNDPGRETATVAEPDPTPTVTQTGSVEPSATPTESPVAAVPTNEVTLKVSALPGGLSWVQVTNASGEVLFSGNLSDGASRFFRDKRRLELVAGNSAGVVLVVNGSDLGSPGGQGEVSRLTFRPGDPDGSVG